MCCGLKVESAQGQALYQLALALWGEPISVVGYQAEWREPMRWAVQGRLTVKMAGYQHAVPPTSWLHVVKFAAGVYEEALRQGLEPVLVQPGIPCPEHLIAQGESPVDMSRLCRAALVGSND